MPSEKDGPEYTLDPDDAIAEDDKDTAVIRHGDGHDGIGWYLWSEDYPDEGSVGAFATKEEAEKFAVLNEYKLEPTTEESLQPPPSGGG